MREARLKKWTFFEEIKNTAQRAPFEDERGAIVLSSKKKKHSGVNYSRGLQRAINTQRPYRLR